MSQARGDSVLKLIANRETLIHKASEQAEFAKKSANTVTTKGKVEVLCAFLKRN